MYGQIDDSRIAINEGYAVVLLSKSCIADVVIDSPHWQNTHVPANVANWLRKIRYWVSASETDGESLRLSMMGQNPAIRRPLK